MAATSDVGHSRHVSTQHRLLTFGDKLVMIPSVDTKGQNDKRPRSSHATGRKWVSKTWIYVGSSWIS